jgi:hypothetical protein
MDTTDGLIQSTRRLNFVFRETEDFIDQLNTRESGGHHTAVQEIMLLGAFFKLNTPTYALHPRSLLLIHGSFNDAKSAVGII